MKYILCILLACCSSIFAKDEQPRIYLSWYNNPATSMTVQWITTDEKEKDTIQYRLFGATDWIEVMGNHKVLPETQGHLVHQVDVKELQADTVYEFRVKQRGDTYKFRTMPTSLDTPLRFAVGGDVYKKKIHLVKAMCRAVAKTNPRFAIIGGDIAYAAGKHADGVDDFAKWLDFFACWTQEMKDQEGCLIPLFTAIGNHEVKGRHNRMPEDAPLYYAFFSRGYYDYGFGSYAHFTFLDSGHTHKIKGKQAKWLKEVLGRSTHFTHRFAIYHVAAYPSSGDFDFRVSTAVRKWWVPLFEKFHLHACFENHDHAYKRTHPLLKDQSHPQGVVYIGDGSWGVKPRVPKEMPYLAHTAEKQQVLIVELSKEDRKFWSIDPEGNLIDYYVQDA